MTKDERIVYHFTVNESLQAYQNYLVLKGITDKQCVNIEISKKSDCWFQVEVVPITEPPTL